MRNAGKQRGTGSVFIKKTAASRLFFTLCAGRYALARSRPYAPFFISSRCSAIKKAAASHLFYFMPMEILTRSRPQRNPCRKLSCLCPIYLWSKCDEAGEYIGLVNWAALLQCLLLWIGQKPAQKLPAPGDKHRFPPFRSGFQRG